MRRQWPLFLGAYSYIVTVTGASGTLLWRRQARGHEASTADVLLWQALVYGLWIPVAYWLAHLFRRFGFTTRVIAAVAGSGAVAIPLHSAVAAALDLRFGMAGPKTFWTHFADRLPVDILFYSAISAAAAAAIMQRRSEEIAGALAEAQDRQRQQSLEEQREEDEPLLVSTGTAQVPVPIRTVEWLGAAGNYVVVNWEEREGLVRGTLREFEERLDARVFARCHRSAIVNLTRVAGAMPLSDGSWRLTMSSGTEVVVSRTYRDLILARLGRR